MIYSETCSSGQAYHEVTDSHKSQVVKSSLTMAALTTDSHWGLFSLHPLVEKGVGKVMKWMTCYISIWSDMLSVLRESTDFDQITRVAVR